MQSKTKLIIGAAALVVVLAGGGILYQSLSKKYMPEGNLANMGTASSASSASSSVSSASAPSSAASSSASSESEDVLVPDFSVLDKDGSTVKFSSFLGKPVIINFWASWCPPCKAEMPEFEKLYQEYGEEIHFLMLNATDGDRETVETAKKFLEGTEYTFPTYFDTGYEASYLFGISSLPTTLFIDKDGYLITGARGQINEKTIRKGIGLILPEDAA